MNFLERVYENEYEELLTFYPRFYRDVLEMDAILRADGYLLDRLMDDIDRTYLNAFIDTADEATIEKWERFLHIATNRTIPLDDRKRLIKAYFVGSGKFSGSLAEAMIKAYLNADSRADFRPFDEQGNNAFFFEIDTNENLTPLMPPLRRLMRQKIPAHLWYVWIQNIDEEIYSGVCMDMRIDNINHQFALDFWNIPRHNGKYFHDGSIRHRLLRRFGFIVGVTHGLAIDAQTNDVGQIEITTFNRDAHFHDGRVLHNGEAKHKTIWRKEVVA